jgi:hypothetical protein
MAAVFSDPISRRNRDGNDEYEIKIPGSNTQLFQDWLISSTDEAVWAFFQSVSDGIAALKLEHYHFKLCNGQYNRQTRAQNNEWYIQIFYGGSTEQEGPLQVCKHTLLLSALCFAINASHLVVTALQ